MTTDYIQRLVTLFSKPKENNGNGKITNNSETGVSKPVSGNIFGIGEKYIGSSGGKASIFSGSLKELDDLDLSGDSVSLEAKNRAEKADSETETADNAVKKEGTLYELLEELYKDPRFAEMIDTDGDKKISDEEAKKFIKAISALDGEKDDFSSKDLKLFLEKANNKIVEAAEREKALEAAALAAERRQAATPLTMMNPARSSFGLGSGFAPSGWSGNYGGMRTTASPPKTLETQKDELENKIEAYEQELAQINSGEQATVKAAIEAENKAKTAMDAQLKQDEAVSEELKLQLEQANKKIATNKNEISQKTTQIMTAESDLTQGANRVTTLNAALASLAQPSGKPEDADKDAKINARRAELQQQITEQEAKNKELKENIEKYKLEKKALEEDLALFETERNDIQKEIEKGASPETKQAIEAYKEAQKNVDMVKASETARVQGELKAAQAQLNTLEGQIETKKNKRAEGSSAEAALEYALNYNGRSASEMAQIMTSKGYTFHNGAWCADFVNFATGMSGERPEWYEGCRNKSYCPTVQAAGLAAGAGIPLQNAQPGDLIMFDFKGQGEPHHIGIYHSTNADGTINVMEGNTGGGSKLRRRNVRTVSSVLSMA